MKKTYINKEKPTVPWGAVLAPISVSLLLGCGGGGGGSSPSDPEILTGVFVDSPVEGLAFSTASQSGTTNSLGEFTYVSGETVTFSIGDIVFGSATAKEEVTPLDLADTDDVNDEAVVNRLRLLQSLDDNDNPDDGIKIVSEAENAGEGVEIDFELSVEEFEVNANLVNFISSATGASELVAKDDAIAHFNETINSESELVGSWVHGRRGLLDPDSSDYLVFTFLADGRFYFAEINEIDEGTGIEFGSYQFSEGSITFRTELDTSGGSGPSALESAVEFHIGFLGDSFHLIEENGEFDINQSHVFVRVTERSDDVIGTWLPNDGSNGVMVLTDDGHLTDIQVDDEGVVYGTYQVNENNNSILHTVLERSNLSGGDLGEHLFLDSFSVSADSLSGVNSDEAVTLTAAFEREEHPLYRREDLIGYWDIVGEQPGDSGFDEDFEVFLADGSLTMPCNDSFLDGQFSIDEEGVVTISFNTSDRASEVEFTGTVNQSRDRIVFEAGTEDEFVTVKSVEVPNSCS